MKRGDILIIEEKDRSNKYNPVHKKMHELWRSMIGRCYSNKNHSYHNYGGRGVRVCDKWLNYDGFLDDVDNIDGYDLDLLLSGELQLDKDIKIKGNKIYSLENCKFVTLKENSANRRNNKYFVAINLYTEEVVLSNNREEFCKERNLDSSTSWRVLQSSLGKRYNGKRHMQHKGWTFQYLNRFDIKEFYEIANNKKVCYKDSTTIESKLSEMGII